MPIRRKIAVAAAVPLLPLGLAACSTGGKSVSGAAFGAGAGRGSVSVSAPVSAPVSTPVSAPASMPSRDPSTSDAGSGSSVTSGAADSSAPPVSGGGYCAVLDDFETELTQVDGTPASVSKLKTTLEQMKQATPPEIAPDVTEAATVVGQITDGADAQTQTQDPAFLTAVGDISTWQSAHCAPGSQ